MNEHHAIELCVKHQDPAGFEFLVRKYRREAYFHALGLLGNQEDALDACQDSFAKAYVAMPNLRLLRDFYPWFYRILRNRCLNMLARRQTSERYRATEADDSTRDSEFSTPARLLESSEQKDRVTRALQSLKAESREILVMKYLQEHSYEEIASILDIPRGTVMSRLYHARLALREAYHNLDGAPAAPSLHET